MQKNKIISILILVSVVFIFMLFIKNSKIAMNPKATNTISGMMANEKTGSTPSGEVNKSLSDSQNGFAINIEKVELMKDKTVVHFKVKNGSNNSISFYPAQSSIVQGTKQYISSSLYLISPTMPNVENEGTLTFRQLENKDKIILYFSSKPYSSSMPKAQWGDIKFEIDLSGDIVVDRVAEEAAKKAKAEEAAYTEYMNSYHGYSESYEVYGGHYPVSSKVDGHQLYIKVIELKKGESLQLEVVYFDDNKEKHVVRTFSTTEVVTKHMLAPGTFAETEDVFYMYRGLFHYSDSQKNTEIYNAYKKDGKYNGVFIVSQEDPNGYIIDNGGIYYPPELGSPFVTSDKYPDEFDISLGSGSYLP